MTEIFLEISLPTKPFKRFQKQISPIEEMINMLKTTIEKDVQLLSLEKITHKKEEQKAHDGSEENYSIIWLFTKSKQPIDQLILMKVDEVIMFLFFSQNKCLMKKKSF